MLEPLSLFQLQPVKNNKEKHTYLTDIAISNDKYVAEKEEEKREKYTPQAMEVKELLATGKSYSYSFSQISHQHHIIF